jgi:unsaturated chondroitin disaccharide hydrolase
MRSGSGGRALAVGRDPRSRRWSFWTPVHRLTRFSALVGAAAALAVTLSVGACGGSATGPRVAAYTVRAGHAVVVPQVALNAHEAVVSLPARSWVVSFDLRLAPGSRLDIGLGYGGAPLTLLGGRDRLRVGLGHGGSRLLIRPQGWLGRGWWHVEATNTQLSIDGRYLPVRVSSASAISFRADAGGPRVSDMIASAARDRGPLLLHRLAELHARIPAGQFPVGATRGDRIVYGSTYWTSGFWPGALWQAAAIAPQGGLFARWALAATLEHFGQERADTHDVGFMYGESSLAAWKARCQHRPSLSPHLCAQLEQSVLTAARELVALATSNPGAGTIPTDSNSPEGDTIIDSMMNTAILPWASRVTHDPAYAGLAAHHAQVVARLFVRPDGSTAQAVNFDRSTGRVLSIVTHEGLSNDSTWSRGEGWALYGFAQAAVDLQDRGLLQVALRLARFVATHLPAGAVPLWDYDAPAGAPIDVSAGVITAAGLFHLATACRTLAGVCGNDPGSQIALGRRMLAAALAHASARPPLGLLDAQVLNEHDRGCWCDGGELIFGVAYALEGLRLEEMVKP